MLKDVIISSMPGMSINDSITDINICGILQYNMGIYVWFSVVCTSYLLYLHCLESVKQVI